MTDQSQSHLTFSASVGRTTIAVIQDRVSLDGYSLTIRQLDELLASLQLARDVVTEVENREFRADGEEKTSEATSQVAAGVETTPSETAPGAGSKEPGLADGESDGERGPQRCVTAGETATTSFEPSDAEVEALAKELHYTWAAFELAFGESVQSWVDNRLKGEWLAVARVVLRQREEREAPLRRDRNEWRERAAEAEQAIARLEKELDETVDERVLSRQPSPVALSPEAIEKEAERQNCVYLDAYEVFRSALGGPGDYGSHHAGQLAVAKDSLEREAKLRETAIRESETRAAMGIERDTALERVKELEKEIAALRAPLTPEQVEAGVKVWNYADEMPVAELVRAIVAAVRGVKSEPAKAPEAWTEEQREAVKEDLRGIGVYMTPAGIDRMVKVWLAAGREGTT